MKTEDIVKWAVTGTQLIGYGMTGLNYRPYNVYMLSLVFFRWFAVGGVWTDKVVMVIHDGAFISTLVAYLNA